ncbi:hypothetical protein [Thermococcus sp.]|uniref:hypothetical protein n=1 Tax=Thermococcus sp. TaxID=35749 RepID=UPI002621452B|nr:hypothetical protein [Thermococcus sp.]
MKIVELDIKLPYKGRGTVLSRLYDRIQGRIRDIHFLPPNAEGISEVRVEIVEDNPAGLLSELKKAIKNGKINFRVLSEI